MNTFPLEADTRTLINKSLENLGWNFDGANKNVYQEQPRTEEERKKLGGKRPDYVLYSKEVDNRPLIVIEAKKKGERIDTALEQGIYYAKKLGAPIVFATDGLFCKSYHTDFQKTPILNGEEVDEFLREALALKYLNTWEVNTISPKVQYDRKELIKVFDEANNMLRGDGLRAGIERFGEFANILFLKLISESEDNKKLIGIESKFDTVCHWDYIKNLNPNSRIEHINKIVYEKLNSLYNTDIFTPLSIRDNSILNEIMKKLDPLTLTDVDSDIKGDAFEYFLKESTATKNDLGEYFTPRHIVKTMVKLVNPQIGEKIYDPFCGTGGFLIESFRHIWNTMPRNENTINMLHNSTIYGNEITNTARITKMNMILAGDGHNGIEMKDSLANPVNGEYDIVLANMPYSQKTRFGNKYDLPTTNGDSICVQHCMKAISSTSENGRMALVVPEGFLFRKDLAKTRELLLRNCELQSIISLPQGVFLPYTGVKTNIIYATKVNQKIPIKDKKQSFWYFEVKSDGYTLDNHRRKLENVKNDLEIYQEYRKLDESQNDEMLNIGFERIDLNKVKENFNILVGSRYREERFLKTNFKLVSLGEIIDIKCGIRITQKNDCGSKYPVYGGGDISFYTDSYTRKDEYVISRFGMSKDCIRYVKGKFYLLDSGFTFDVKSNYRDYIKKDYIGKVLITLKNEIFNCGRGQAQLNIDFDLFYKIKIPIPSWKEQEEIVDELNGYEEIITGAKLIMDNYRPIIKIEPDWKIVKLSNLVEINKESINPKKNEREDEFIYIDISSVEKETGKIDLSKIIKNMEAPSRARRKIHKGDILISTVRPNLQSFAYIDFEPDNHIASTGFAVLTPNKKIDSKFLYYIFFDEFIGEQLRNAMNKAMYPSVNKSDLENLDIPVPLLSIQKKIVEEIEKQEKIIKPLIELIEIYTAKIKKRINDLFNI